jgi:hypothetical protein
MLAMLGDSPIHKQNQINYKKQSRIGDDDDDDDRGTLNVYSDVWKRALPFTGYDNILLFAVNVNGRFSRENFLYKPTCFYLFYVCMYVCTTNGTFHHRFIGNMRSKKKRKTLVRRNWRNTFSLSIVYTLRGRKRKDFLGSTGIQITCCLS